MNIFVIFGLGGNINWSACLNYILHLILHILRVFKTLICHDLAPAFNNYKKVNYFKRDLVISKFELVFVDHRTNNLQHLVRGLNNDLLACCFI